MSDRWYVSITVTGNVTANGAADAIVQALRDLGATETEQLTVTSAHANRVPSPEERAALVLHGSRTVPGPTENEAEPETA